MKPDRSSVIDALLKSDEPSIRWKVMTRVVGEDTDSRKIRNLQEEIRTSPRARALIAGRDQRFRARGARVRDVARIALVASDAA